MDINDPAVSLTFVLDPALTFKVLLRVRTRCSLSLILSFLQRLMKDTLKSRWEQGLNWPVGDILISLRWTNNLLISSDVFSKCNQTKNMNSKKLQDGWLLFTGSCVNWLSMVPPIANNTKMYVCKLCHWRCTFLYVFTPATVVSNMI